MTPRAILCHELTAAAREDAARAEQALEEWLAAPAFLRRGDLATTLRLHAEAREATERAAATANYLRRWLAGVGEA